MEKTILEERKKTIYQFICDEFYVPMKAKDEKLQDVTKYGGYTSLKPSYFVFFEHGSEKKRKKCFEVVHSYYASQIKNKADLTKFLEESAYKI